MRENRLSGLMRGGKQTVIGPRASQSVASRLLYLLPQAIRDLGTCWEIGKGVSASSSSKNAGKT